MRRVLWLVVLALLLADVWWLYPAYKPWLAGQDVSESTLSIFGLPSWPISHWARLGKVLQFVAGLTIVLDLVDVRKVRKRLEELRSRIRLRKADFAQFNKAHNLYLVDQRIFDAIVDKELSIILGDEPTYRLRQSPRPLSGDTPIPLEGAIQGLHARAISEAAHHHTCRHPHSHHVRLCQEQLSWLRREIEEIIGECLPVEDKTVRERVAASRDRVAAVFLFLSFGGMGMFCWNDDKIVLAAISTLMFLLAIMVIATGAGRFFASVSLYSRIFPSLAACYALVAVLERTRNPRILRVIAVLLFVLGFQLDLLAS